MNKDTSIGRPKTIYDPEEVKEIIEMKLKSVGYDISKLTYNSVFKFNQYLVDTKKKNFKNEVFTLYGYSFWVADYKGVPNYGKEQIDIYKQHHTPIIAGEIFNVTTNDIESIIDNNQDDPQKMKKVLIKLFTKERENNARNDKAFDDLVKQVNKYKNLADQYKQALFMMFYNSRYSDNSLNDVITLQQESDTYIRDEILRIFDNNRILIDEIEQMKESQESGESIDKILNDNILDMAKIFEQRKS